MHRQHCAILFENQNYVHSFYQVEITLKSFYMAFYDFESIDIARGQWDDSEVEGHSKN